MASKPAGNLFNEALTLDRLRRVYEARIGSTSARGRDGQSVEAFSVSLEVELPRIRRRLAEGTFRFTAYRQLALPRGAHKTPRIISVASVRDRLVLRWLAELLYEIYPEVRRPVASALTRELAKELASAKYTSFLKLDIQDFYSSIEHNALMRRLRARIRKPALLEVISCAIRTPTAPMGSRTADLRSAERGVPQGLSISNVLADLAMSNLDRRMQSRSGIAYFRFVDDIIVLASTEDVGGLRREIVKYCSTIGVTIHPEEAKNSKSYSGVISEPIDYLGYVYRAGVVSVRPSSVGRLRETILRAFTRYGYAARRAKGNEEQIRSARAELDWKIDLIVSGCVFDHQARGWLHYFSQITDLQLLSSLDSFVRKQSKRFAVASSGRKRFVKAYWLICNPSGATEAYVPNFDRWTIEEKRELLASVLGIQNLDRWQNAEVASFFRARISQVVQELERDLQPLS